MTKPKEPSKKTVNVLRDAINEWNSTPGYIDSENKAARIIQRHVDREVRKAVKQAQKNAEALLIQSAIESGFAAKMEVVKCAEAYVAAKNTPNPSDNEKWFPYVKLISKCEKDLIAAVKAMKEGKK